MNREASGTIIKNQEFQSNAKKKRKKRERERESPNLKDYKKEAKSKRDLTRKDKREEKGRGRKWRLRESLY